MVKKTPPIFSQETYIVTIKRIGIYGEGVTEIEGFTVFVPLAIPGEIHKVRLTDIHTTFARAQSIEILSTSPYRKKAPCPLFGTCGGCQIMHVDYSYQLEKKREKVQDAMDRIAKISCLVNPCIASPLQLHYRNKIQMPALCKDTSISFGLYAADSHDIVEIETCYIHSEEGNYVYKQIKSFINKEFPSLIPYIHALLLKTSFYKKESLATFITTKEEISSLSHMAHLLIEKIPSLKGVTQNWGSHHTNRWIGSHHRILAGEGEIEEKILDLSFHISPAAFFQVNPLQAEVLYKYVVELCKNLPLSHIVDAYCGVGTLSLILCQYLHIPVTGIEVVKEAVENAQKNALYNHLPQAKFIEGTVEKKLQSCLPVELVILNPPRKGCDKAALEALCLEKTAYLIYISCDPATLARDLAFLCSKGYKPHSLQPFDLFPQTMHIETVAFLSWQ